MRVFMGKLFVESSVPENGTTNHTEHSLDFWVMLLISVLNCNIIIMGHLLTK